MQGYGKTGKDVKCPVMHGSMTNTEYGMANRDWWPNSLNLKILSQHSSLVDPMGKKFNYAKEFKKINLKDKSFLFEQKNIFELISDLHDTNSAKNFTKVFIATNNDETLNEVQKIVEKKERVLINFNLV